MSTMSLARVSLKRSSLFSIVCNDVAVLMIFHCDARASDIVDSRSLCRLVVINPCEIINTGLILALRVQHGSD